MKQYLGVKMIKATPMDRATYNDYRGWDLPENEKHLADEAGMLVEYEDTGHPNHTHHRGYISWSPLTVFEEAYRETIGLTFGLAIEALKLSHKVARTGWNGKGQFIKYYKPDIEYTIKEGTFKRSPYFYLKNAQDELVPWVPSMGDCLAEDWIVI